MVLGGVLGESVPLSIAVVAVTTGVIWVGSGWLEASAEHLATHYGLPPVIQGSVVVAVGSSFPELSTVVITAVAGIFDMGIGGIVGSAIFNILVIPALAGLATEGHLDANRQLVYKEAQFYMIAVASLLLTFAFAVIYHPTDAGPLVGTITRPLAAIPVALYGLYLFIQWQDVADHDAPAAGIDGSVWREWLRLAGGLALIFVGVEQLVRAVEHLSGVAGVPHFLAGVTIVAAATSLPDAIVSVRVARDGSSVTSLGNVLGSNTFDLLIAIPIGVLIVGRAPVDFATAVPMMGVLILATVVLFTILRTDLQLTRWESVLLLVGYVAFVVWVVAETLGVTTVIPGA